MSLVLYGHPFSSYTQKVLIALYENGTPFEFRCLGPETPEHGAEWARRWPLRKFPLLLDGERDVAEASIIIEYLHLSHPGPVRLLPTDPVDALDVRFLDRFFDLYVMEPMQFAVFSALSLIPVKREDGLALAKERFERAYAWLEDSLPAEPGRPARTSASGLRGRARAVLCGLDALGSRMPIRFCALIARACLPARPSPGRSRRRGLSAELPSRGSGPGLEFPREDEASLAWQKGLPRSEAFL